MEIRPYIGLDNLVFGLSEEEVRSRLGVPDLVDESWDDENELIYQYNKYRIRLSFFQENGGQLGYIRCANEDIQYKNQPIIGQNIETIKSDVFKLEDSKWEVEEYEFSQCYYSKELNLSINVQYNSVTDIEIGKPFSN